MIEDGVPVMGVVHVPVTGKTYYGSLDNGSYVFTYEINNEISIEEYISKAVKLPCTKNASVYTIVASRAIKQPRQNNL